MSKYTKTIRESMVAKLCSPGGPTAYTLSRETGIPVPTLYSWKKRMGGRIVGQKQAITRLDGN